MTLKKRKNRYVLILFLMQKSLQPKIFVAKNTESTILQLIGFFISKLPINGKFLDIHPPNTDINMEYKTCTHYVLLGNSTNYVLFRKIMFSCNVDTELTNQSLLEVNRLAESELCYEFHAEQLLSRRVHLFSVLTKNRNPF